jgi:hypothetical protein
VADGKIQGVCGTIAVYGVVVPDELAEVLKSYPLLIGDIAPPTKLPKFFLEKLPCLNFIVCPARNAVLLAAVVKGDVPYMIFHHAAVGKFHLALKYSTDACHLAFPPFLVFNEKQVTHGKLGLLHNG